MRWVSKRLHLFTLQTLWVAITTGAIQEVSRPLLAELDIDNASSSAAGSTPRS